MTLQSIRDQLHVVEGNFKIFRILRANREIDPHIHGLRIRKFSAFLKL